MARKYRIDRKRVMTGAEMIALAKREFNKDSKGIGRYGRPTTKNKAVYFLKLSIKGNKGHIVETKLQSEKEWDRLL